MKFLHMRRILPLLCALLICTALWAESAQSHLADQMIRLHVLANSDTLADQALKHKVRDRILLETESLLQTCRTPQEAQSILTAQLSHLSITAEELVFQEGYRYPVSVSLENTWFPTRTYDTFSLPAGTYQALRIVIGNGDGHNWWCVLFPPLCLSSVTENSTATETLTAQEVSLITEDAKQFELRFRTIELWSSIKNLFS